jgi:predicted nucleotidyltransferase
MPNMGMNESKPATPNKGSESRHPRRSLADALFSSTQKRVLGLLFGQPQRSFYANEIIERLGAGSGAVQRELKKLAESGLVEVSWVGNQKHFQANPDSPIFPELRALMRKTVGLADPVREALEPAQEAIELAAVYGSVAKGQEIATSDVDLMLVSDTLTLEAVYRLLAGAEQALGRKINPTLYTSDEFRRRRRRGDSFLKRVLSGDLLVLLGSLTDE